MDLKRTSSKGKSRSGIDNPAATADGHKIEVCSGRDRHVTANPELTAKIVGCCK